MTILTCYKLPPLTKEQLEILSDCLTAEMLDLSCSGINSKREEEVATLRSLVLDLDSLETETIDTEKDAL